MGMIAAIASSALSLVGGIVQGEGQKESADYQAKVSRNNAITAANNASIATEMGDVKSADSGFKTAQVLGKAKADQGASGIDTNSGSAVASMPCIPSKDSRHQ